MIGITRTALLNQSEWGGSLMDKQDAFSFARPCINKSPGNKIGL